MRTVELNRMIDHWLADGVITAEQAGRMRTAEPAPAHRGALIAEGLGYLGGALVAAALGILAGQYWTELGHSGRLAVVGGAAVLLAVAGAVVPRAAHGPAARLRAVLWAAACGAVLGFLMLLAGDPIGWHGTRALSFAAAGTLLCAAGFWWRNHHPVQHTVTFVAGVLLAAALVGLVPDAGMLPGLAVWSMGAGWLLAARAGLVRPALLGHWLGIFAACVGAVVVAGTWWGSVLALATVAALVAASVAVRDTALLVTASLAALFIVPPVVGLWFPGVLSAVVALLAAGLLLVAAGVVLARRRPDRSAGTREEAGSPGGAGPKAGRPPLARPARPGHDGR